MPFLLTPSPHSCNEIERKGLWEVNASASFQRKTNKPPNQEIIINFYFFVLLYLWVSWFTCTYVCMYVGCIIINSIVKMKQHVGHVQYHKVWSNSSASEYSDVFSGSWKAKEGREEFDVGWHIIPHVHPRKTSLLSLHLSHGRICINTNTLLHTYLSPIMEGKLLRC